MAASWAVRYERRARPFAEMNQALVTEGNATLCPGTAEALAARNRMLRGLTAPPVAANPIVLG